MYKLICGSIFDKKCDLIVIPCNNMGIVAKGIKKDLMVNEIPFYREKIIPGEIHFSENAGGFRNASVIGFASTVNVLRMACDPSYLENICKAIISYCENNSLHIVNIPLLGSGAGGMTHRKSFDILKLYFEANALITLNIFAYSRDIYSDLQRYDKKSGQAAPIHPRVFISYTGIDPVNRKWVKSLACKLRQNGVDARIDMFHLKPGQDLPQWMTNELIMADKVLLICDKHYAEKADARNGGVGWETMIIQGDMMSHMESGKYICILRERNIDQGLPIYVKSKYSLQWTEPEISGHDLNELLYHLFDCDLEPAIGDIPKFIIDKLNN